MVQLVVQAVDVASAGAHAIEQHEDDKVRHSDDEEANAAVEVPYVVTSNAFSEEDAMVVDILDAYATNTAVRDVGLARRLLDLAVCAHSIRLFCLVYAAFLTADDLVHLAVRLIKQVVFSQFV